MSFYVSRLTFKLAYASEFMPLPTASILESDSSSIELAQVLSVPPF